MITELARTDTPEALKEAAARAAELLRAGEVVALPTETVYGLGADARNEAALAKVFAAKERPHFDPLIVHLPSARMLPEVAEVPGEIAKEIARLTETFWPGPLSILLPRRADAIPDIATAGLPNVVVRVSEDPTFRRIAKAFGGPIAAPSANRFGRISPTSAAAVEAELGGRIPLIVDGGACSRGLESTIIAVSPPPAPNKKPIITILRPGPVTRDELKKFGKVEDGRVHAGKPETPGQLPSHYAPRTPLRIVEDPAAFLPEPGKRYALLSFKGEDEAYLNLAAFDQVALLSPGAGKMPEAAIRFFFLLRQLDECGADEILAEPIPERGLGIAMMDRLRRAAAGSGSE
ncbi:MAG: L-threonylcarbamoyladenylate synthase [Verrucomicrobiales bacterium]